MLAGEEIAEVSNGAFGATPSNKKYSLHKPSPSNHSASDVTSLTQANASKNAWYKPRRRQTMNWQDSATSPPGDETPQHKQYVFWDTPGLNEDERGTVRSEDVYSNLMTLAQSPGLNLIVYCIRASRFTEAVKVNYDLFWRIICDKEVPIVLVVTGLEQEENMDNWWPRYKGDFGRMEMKFRGEACITTTRGRDDVYAAEYQQSRDKVWDLVQRCCADKAWRMKEQRPEVEKKMKKYMGKYNERSGMWTRVFFWRK